MVVTLLVLSVGCSNDAGGTAPNGQFRGTAAFDSGFDHRTADVNGARTHYVIGGRGPAVVLLHGFPETWYAWRGVMPALAEEHTVIAPDLRGVGESSIEESGYDKETMAEDVYQLVREAGFEEVSVVGHDLGAMVAYAYAREHRGEVRRLVFMSASLPGFGLEELMDFSEPGQGRYQLAFFMQPELPEKLIEGRERYFLTEFIGSAAVTGTDGLDEYARAYSRSGRLEAGLNQYRTLYQDAEDNREKASPKLAMPVLALGGGLGRSSLPLESMRRVAEDVARGASWRTPVTTCKRSNQSRSPTGCWTSSAKGLRRRTRERVFVRVAIAALAARVETALRVL